MKKKQKDQQDEYEKLRDEDEDVESNDTLSVGSIQTKQRKKRVQVVNQYWTRVLSLKRPSLERRENYVIDDYLSIKLDIEEGQQPDIFDDRVPIFNPKMFFEDDETPRTEDYKLKDNKLKKYAV